RRSTADALEFFWPRLSPGGMLVVDDYGIATCPGVRTAVEAFFAGKSERPLILPTGQAVLPR
ncbi:TylF/MycF/NovP-related O-methyltransferase, partial [Salmonella enterica]|uniref:TylF/MycF/NovP-related O-methyltransferase n=1 Tax=Salmonella enterica TaxID=28901 RepID=UPI003D26DF99